MSTFIYEDQENRVANQRRKREDENQTNISNPPAFTSKSLNNSKRTVLGNLSVNSNIVRVQPSRAAKQGVCYESGAPQISCNESTKPRSSSQLSLPSFTIYEDVSSTTSCRSTSSNEASAAQLQISSKRTDAKSCASLDSFSPSVVLKEAKNVATVPGSSFSRRTPRKPAVECLTSPEAMDISLCDSNLMSVETTDISGEDILQSRDEVLWDVPEYASAIYKYLRQAELCHKPRVGYMAKQNDITAGMRWILVDWLVEVAEEYELQTETLFLAVSYVDRFLSHMSVKRDKLQLVGTTAMFIASKYEEIYPPEVGQFAYITDNTYKKSQILRMEHLILKVLSFDMAVPTAYLFVNKFTKLCKSSEETLHLSCFIAELSMLDCDPFLRYLPSLIGASAVALANYTLGKPVWPEHVAASSQYQLSDLKECYINLNNAYCKIQGPSQHAIRDKYKVNKWNSVSALSPREGFPWS